MTDTAFRGTLLLLQNRTRRDPESYREEFLAQLDHFKALGDTVEAQAGENPQFVAVLNYVCHVAHCYPAEVAGAADLVVALLRRSKGGAMHSSTRLALVKSLALLRSKDIVALDVTFSVLFELLQERDKTLRKFILAHLVSDIRKVNMPGAKNGAVVNRKAQNFLFAVMADDDAVQARCAEIVMIDLYRRRVWCNDRTVEVMTAACFSRHTVILRTALRFFLMQMPKITSVDDEDEDGDTVDPGRSISKMKQKLKIVKKTSKRQRMLKRDMGKVKRKYDKEQRAEEEFARQHVDPIRLLRDPQQFVERLLARLQKTSERFEVRILYLNVIARVISEHEVVHLPVYTFLERYMEPSQLHVTELLALSSMCVHRMVPPDSVEPLVRAIANHFVSDRSTPDAITVGINTIREMCKRQPLAMDETLLRDLVEYKSQRGDRGVMMAARALLQLYRDVNPELLPAKLRGSKSGPTAESGRPAFGAPSPLHDIPGMELLLAAEADPSALDELDDDDGGASADGSSGSDASTSSSSDSDSGEWVTDSDEIGSSDVDGEFVDVSDASEDLDECPQLVPVAANTAAKRSSATNHDDDEDVDDVEPQASKRRRLERASGSVVQTSNKSNKNEKSTKKASSTSTGSSSSSGSMIHISDSDEDGWGEWEEQEEDDDDSDDEEEDSSDEEDGEWEKVSSADSDGEEEEDKEGGEENDADDESDDEEVEEEEAEESDESDDEEVEEEEEEEDADSEWVEEAAGSVASRPSRTASTSASTKASKTSLSTVRLLTDDDFARIRKLQQQNGGHRSLRLKAKEKEERKKRKHDLLHDVSADLTARDIEHFTERKREADREDRAASVLAKREANSKNELRKKNKSKLNSTHIDHSKRGKLFQMTKRSRRVAAKLKSSAQDKESRRKDMKKKDIRFRIRRGWKA